jgi:prevent-host-death family protein
MRNHSAEILRAVAAGETIQVTNNGKLAAIISPPSQSVLDRLAAEGKVRPALKPMSNLAKIKAKKGKVTAEQILDDVRGRW